MSINEQALSLKMSGSEKAAILLLSLGDEISAEVMKELAHREIQQITGTVTRLPIVSQSMIDQVQSEFMERMSTQVSISSRQARDKICTVLSKFLSEEEVDRYLDDVMMSEDVSEGFDSLASIDSETVATFISNEHPQTIALVLAHLDPAKAAEVLAELPKEQQSDVVKRIANIGRVAPSVVKDIQEVLVQDIVASGGGGGKGRTVGGAQTVAEVMNNLDGQTMRSIFTDLEETDKSFAEEIRALMFVFNDLIKIDDRALQSIIKEVTNDVLTMALKLASEELREMIFKNISSRAAEMIAEELEVMGPVKMTDVEGAQQEIVAIARRLEEEGKITLGTGGGEVLV